MKPEPEIPVWGVCSLRYAWENAGHKPVNMHFWDKEETRPPQRNLDSAAVFLLFSAQTGAICRKTGKEYVHHEIVQNRIKRKEGKSFA